MPRPGPRPYECVRRAWHSDRHQPIRGSLIQEIFRVVSEIHAPVTRKNKEWQDKLPVVVLKVEEIMYSKANSEAEYMDLNTLWERANDAINTIIRLDESSETGVSLQPCIEAALILGCTPRKATRSERNNTPNYYLNAAGTKPTCTPSGNLQKGTHNYSKIFAPNNMNSGNPGPSVYPLYHGHEPRYKDIKIGIENPVESYGRQEEPAQLGGVQDISACWKDARNVITKPDCRITYDNSPEIGCDLSLRLGPCNPPLGIKNRWPQDFECFGSYNSVGSKNLSNSDPQLRRSFYFNIGTADNNSLNSSSSNWGSEIEKINANATFKKRKGVFDHLYEDTQISRKGRLSHNHHAG